MKMVRGFRFEGGSCVPRSCVLLVMNDKISIRSQFSIRSKIGCFFDYDLDHRFVLYFNILFCSCRCLVLWPSRQLHFKTSSFKDTAKPSAVYWVPECKVPWWFGGGPANPVMSGKDCNIDILIKNFWP